MCGGSVVGLGGEWGLESRRESKLGARSRCHIVFIIGVYLPAEEIVKSTSVSRGNHGEGGGMGRQT